jgi:hypothetical protein
LAAKVKAGCGTARWYVSIGTGGRIVVAVSRPALSGRRTGRCSTNVASDSAGDGNGEGKGVTE